jgi:hypothetical protein
MIAIGLGLLVVAVARTLLVPQWFPPDRPMPRGPNLNGLLALLGLSFWLLAGHRYLGRRMFEKEARRKGIRLDSDETEMDRLTRWYLGFDRSENHGDA